ncbi:MAG: DUF938 domain-containing protein, partial [Roseinatronobacter sp.]
RLRNADWGLRAREDVDAAAGAHGFACEAVHVMPADNRLLVYRLL